MTGEPHEQNFGGKPESMCIITVPKTCGQTNETKQIMRKTLIVHVLYAMLKMDGRNKETKIHAEE